MQAGRRTIAAMAAFLLLIASLGGLWRVLVANTEMRLTGETLSNYARDHPPKPWRGFEIAILNVAIKGEVHIKAHLSRTELPQDAARPMLSRFNAMLNPLATYIARNLADIIPAKRIKAETPGGALF